MSLFFKPRTRYMLNTISFLRLSRLPSGWAIPTSLGKISVPLQTRRQLGQFINLSLLFSSLMKRQLAFLIARAQIPLQWLQIPLSEDEAEESFESDLQDCLFNAKLSHHFRAFGKELGVEDPRSLEDVYKSHLENTRTSISVILRLFTYNIPRRNFCEHRFRSC